MYTYLFYLFTCLILVIYFAEFYCKLYNAPRLALLHAGCIYKFFSNLLNLNYLNKCLKINEMIEIKNALVDYLQACVMLQYNNR